MNPHESSPIAPGQPLETARLRLVPSDRRHDRALRAGAAAFEKEFGLRVAAVICEYVQPEERDVIVDAWHSFLIVLATDLLVIGLCGRTKVPDENGAVEIAYGIAPEYRQRGYATEAAQMLTIHAFCDPNVKAVYANTLPETNPSTRVLTKAGFQLAGEIMHPEDGKVWRWEARRVDRPASLQKTP
jgi:[ribosomal protein S5]-alanine N-acetyltransferase